MIEIQGQLCDASVGFWSGYLYLVGAFALSKTSSFQHMTLWDFEIWSAPNHVSSPSFYLKFWEQMLYVCSTTRSSINILLFLVWLLASNRCFYSVENKITAAYGSLESCKHLSSHIWSLSLKSSVPTPDVCSEPQNLLSHICSAGFAVYFSGWLSRIKTTHRDLYGVFEIPQNDLSLSKSLFSSK